MAEFKSYIFEKYILICNLIRLKNFWENFLCLKIIY